MPVLTEQALEGAGLIEDSQVPVAIFRSLRIGKPGVTGPGATRTNPIGYTVGGQGIIVPADIALASGGTDKSIFSGGAQPAIAPAIWRDTTFIET